MHMYDGATRCLDPHTHNRAASHVCIVGLHAFVGRYICGERRPTNERMKRIIIFHHSFSYRFFFIHREIYRMRWRHALRAREQAIRRRAPSSTPKNCAVRSLGGIAIFLWTCNRIFSYFLVAPPTFMRGFCRRYTNTSYLQTSDPHKSHFLFIFPNIFLSSFQRKRIKWAKKRIYAVDDKFLYVELEIGVRCVSMVFKDFFLESSKDQTSTFRIIFSPPFHQMADGH